MEILTFFILVKIFQGHPILHKIGGQFFEEVDGMQRKVCMQPLIGKISIKERFAKIGVKMKRQKNH